jgi:putative tricarboxylic transport membrane protein
MCAPTDVTAQNYPTKPVRVIVGFGPGGVADLTCRVVAQKLSAQLGQQVLIENRPSAGGIVAADAVAKASFIPMLTLGIPTSPVMALMIGAMIIQGVQPGPSVMTDQPALFWEVIASMWMGNLFLLVLNLPMIGLWVRLCMAPYHLLYPAILVFCGIGVFSLSNSEFDIHLMTLFGVLGYLFAKLDCEPAPMLLAMILGPLMEEHLRRALILSRGDPTIFLRRPISLGILLVTAVAPATAVLPAIRSKREEAFKEDGPSVRARFVCLPLPMVKTGCSG